MDKYKSVMLCPLKKGEQWKMGIKLVVSSLTSSPRENAFGSLWWRSSSRGRNHEFLANDDGDDSLLLLPLCGFAFFF